MRVLTIWALLFVCASAHPRRINLNFEGLPSQCPPPPPCEECPKFEIPNDKIFIIKERGFLKCGTTPSPPYASWSVETQTWSGIDIELCKGIAAAIFGTINPSFEIIPSNFEDRWDDVKHEKFDVGVMSSTYTFERENGLNVSFSTFPYSWVVTAPTVYKSRGWSSNEEIEGTVCYMIASTEETLAEEEFEGNTGVTLRGYSSFNEMYGDFFAGICAAVVGNFNEIDSFRVDPADFEVLDTLAVERFDIFTRREDETLRKIASWVNAALISAAGWGMTKANVNRWVPKTAEQGRLLGGSNTGQESLGLDRFWGKFLISSVGNIEEIYFRILGRSDPMNSHVNHGGLFTSATF